MLKHCDLNELIKMDVFTVSFNILNLQGDN